MSTHDQEERIGKNAQTCTRRVRVRMKYPDGGSVGESEERNVHFFFGCSHLDGFSKCSLQPGGMRACPTDLQVVLFT